MASSGQGNKAYDFGSDDILCSYEDFGAHQDANSGAHSYPPVAVSSAEELHKSRSSVTIILGKQHIARQKNLHFIKVCKPVEILRDKQELADTQKGLAELQLAQKESSSADSPWNEDKASTPAVVGKKGENYSDIHDEQLAIVPHQASQPPLPSKPYQHHQTLMAPPSSMPQLRMLPSLAYYLLPPQTSAIAVPSQRSHCQYLPVMSQVQVPSMVAPAPPLQSQINPCQQVHLAPPYARLRTQLPNQPPRYQPVMQQQIRNPSQIVYSSCRLNQPPAEMAPNNMPMQVPYMGPSQGGPPGPVMTRMGTMH